MTEIYEIPQGKMVIAFSNEDLSIGLLKLDPKQELDKHNRPVKEELVQISGVCTIKFFDNDKLKKEVTLKESEKLEILSNQFHIHSNPTNETSITLWKFEGNIVEVIEDIRDKFKRIL